jgi:hypothetical protein
VGYALCFGANWGAVGLWVGLSVGLILVGIGLVGVWARRVRNLARQPPSVLPLAQRRG